jgi:hypothetical protein
MAVNNSHTSTASITGMEPAGPDDRYCRHCGEIALAYDPTAGKPRCRACNQLR